MEQDNDMISAAIEILLKDNQSIKYFLFNHDITRLKIKPETFENDLKGMSKGEKILACIAMDFWSDFPHTSIYSIIHALDSRRYHNFIKAIDLLKGTNYAAHFQINL